LTPFDTYKIWKIGANLRANMTLDGFDGFRIQRADYSILFHGEGSNDGRVGIDVTEVVLLLMLTWRCQEKTEIVGQWKAKVCEMYNVVVSVKSRKVPGAITDDEFKNEKKGWFGGWRKRDQKSEGQKKLAPPKSSVSIDGRKSDASNSSPSRNPIKPGRHSMDVVRGDEPQRGRDKKTSTLGNVEGGSRRKEGG
ncbi:Ankyrin repeat domain-containing protein 13B, partial [Bienertia sinuspersici]